MNATDPYTSRFAPRTSFIIVDEHVNIQNRLQSGTINSIDFASEDDESRQQHWGPDLSAGGSRSISEENDPVARMDPG